MKQLFSLLLTVMLLTLPTFAQENYYVPQALPDGTVYWDIDALYDNDGIPLVIEANGAWTVPVNINNSNQHPLHAATLAWMADGGTELVNMLVGHWKREWRAETGVPQARFINEQLQSWLRIRLPGTDMSPAELIRLTSLYKPGWYDNAISGTDSDPCEAAGGNCQLQYVCYIDGRKYYCGCDDSCLDCCTAPTQLGSSGGDLHAVFE